MIEAEKRGRSTVLAGFAEALMDLSPKLSLKHLEDKVDNLIVALQVECRPSEAYRMGKFDPVRTRLVEIVFPSKYYWCVALANARLLRSTGLPDLFVWKSDRV